MFSRVIARYQIIVDDELVWSERHDARLEPLSLGERSEKTRARRVRRLNSLRTFDREAVVEAEIECAVQPRTTRRVARLLELLKEPVSANGISRLLQERHDYLGCTERDIGSMGRSADSHHSDNILSVVRGWPPLPRARAGKWPGSTDRETHRRQRWAQLPLQPPPPCAGGRRVLTYN